MHSKNYVTIKAKMTYNLEQREYSTILDIRKYASRSQYSRYYLLSAWEILGTKLLGRQGVLVCHVSRPQGHPVAAAQSHARNQPVDWDSRHCRPTSARRSSVATLIGEVSFLWTYGLIAASPRCSLFRWLAALHCSLQQHQTGGSAFICWT